MKDKYEIKEWYDEKKKSWVYEIKMPEEDKAVLDDVLAQYGLTFETAPNAFFKWIIREPEKASQWIRDNE